MRIVIRSGCRRESRRQFRVIESRGLGSFRAVNHHELSSFSRSHAIPKAIIALPNRPYAGAINERVGVVAHPLFRASIVGGGYRALVALLADSRNSNEKD